MAAPLQRRLRIILLVLLLGLATPGPSWAEDGQAGAVLDPARVDTQTRTTRSLADKGPLEGKNFSPHYQIFFNLPGISARPPAGARYALGVSTYLSQEFLASYEGSGDEAVLVRHADFENLSLEANARWYPSDRLQLGATLRLIGYGGGILDWPVEAFHGLFGFSNAGRESFPQQDVYVDYSSDEGYRFHLEQNRLSFGDLDLWAAGTLFDAPSLATALLVGLKLPTGSFDALSGSGGADLALAVLIDLNLHSRFSMYLNTGLTLALFEPHAAGGTRTAFAQAIVALEYAFDERLSFLLQGNLKSPSMHADIIMKNNLGQVGDQLGFPQTNILFGLRRKSGQHLVQAYMEEDALTNNGVDFSFNFGITRYY
jgi:hypothetical protein